MKVAVVLSIAIIFAAAGDIFMSAGMKERGEVVISRWKDIPPLMKLVFTSPFIIAGILSMAIYFFFYITALAWVDVSVATPITALSYVIASAYAFLRLREHFSLARVIGIFLITIGAVFVGVSS